MERKKNNVPRVGVALLAYNQGNYVKDMIDSLKRQTFQDFEVLLADDNSNDGFTRQALEALNYEKITKKIIDTKNMRNAKRRAQLYGLLNNEFVIDLSADDVLVPDFLEKTVLFLEENKDYGAVSTNYRMFEKSIDDYYYEGHFKKEKMNLRAILARNQVLGSSLMRNAALKETDLGGGFTRYQDWDRWISMMEKGWKIGLIEEPLFYYRQLTSSLSHSASVEDELEIRKKLLNKHGQSYKKYYKDVILDMEYAFLEMKAGKDWLDGQYRCLIKSEAELRKEIEELNKERRKLKQGTNRLGAEIEEMKKSRAMQTYLSVRKRIKGC